MELCYPREQVEVEIPSDDGGQRKHVMRLGPEGVHPLADDLSDADGQTRGAKVFGRQPPTIRVLVDGAARREVTQKLADEEGIAVGLRGQSVAQGKAVIVHLVACVQLQKGQELVVPEPSE